MQNIISSYHKIQNQ